MLNLSPIFLEYSLMMRIGAIGSPSLEPLQTDLVYGELREGVLHDAVLHGVLRQLTAKLRILGDRNAPVVHEHARARRAQTAGQFLDYRLLLAENSCIRHFSFFTSGSIVAPKK